MRPNLLNLMRDQYGCHVVKLLLHKFPLDELDFVFTTVHQNCRDLGEGALVTTFCYVSSYLRGFNGLKASLPLYRARARHCHVMRCVLL